MKEARHLRRCPVCREAGPRLGEQLLALPTPTLTASERDRLWQGIRMEIEAKPAWRTPAILPWLRKPRRRHPMLVWVTAAAAAILLAVVPLYTGREERRLIQGQRNAQTVIERIEAAPAASVFILEMPTKHLSIIWVLEPPQSRRGT